MGSVLDMLRSKGLVRSSKLDCVDQAFLAQVRTFLNDGRATARAFFYKTIAFFLMQKCSKASMRLVNPTAAMPALEAAEGSPYFAYVTYHVASANGVLAAVSPASVSAPAPAGSTGGTFVTVRSVMQRPKQLGGNIIITRDVGTDSSYTSAAGLRYPRVPGEHIIGRKGCMYADARALKQELAKGKFKAEPQVDMATAKTIRLVLTGQAIPWTAADGSDRVAPKVVGPGHWWLMIPRLTTRSGHDLRFQTLTAEEQNRLRLGSPALGLGGEGTVVLGPGGEKDPEEEGYGTDQAVPLLGDDGAEADGSDLDLDT